MYELWEMVSYGMGEPLVPFILNNKSDSFEKIYNDFTELIKKQPCVIVYSHKKETEG